MSRTTAADVQAVLGGNWDQTTDLTPFIDTASELVDDAISCATTRGVTISATRAELIERWLAAYYYTQMDPLYTSRSTADASGSFRDQDYSKAAISLDSSGCLKALLNGTRSATAIWLGKRPSVQTPYYQRD